MTAQERLDLQEKGYVMLPDFMSRELLEETTERVEQLWQDEGDNAGAEFRQELGTRRLANLVAKGKVFQRMVVMPEILKMIEVVLGPRFKLSSFNARSANPQNGGDQPLHVDMGLVADEGGYAVCNTVWMLDPFTPANGALRIIPGSHQWRKRPQDELADLNAPHPGEILVTGAAGTVVVMNAHLWHGGTANRTASPRRALHAFYCRWDIAQQQYQKKLIAESAQVSFSPALRQVLALDDPLNDELSAACTRQSGFLK
jgi:ectoine hydroxylase-related dioxygenase (phytanoyl-CoA dioxygenase family)